jgi:hypothetical protein
MQLTDAQVIQYQTLYKNRFGKEISKVEALESGIKLVRLMELTYKKMTVQDQEKVLIRQQILNN